MNIIKQIDTIKNPKSSNIQLNSISDGSEQRKKIISDFASQTNNSKYTFIKNNSTNCIHKDRQKFTYKDFLKSNNKLDSDK